MNLCKLFGRVISPIFMGHFLLLSALCAWAFHFSESQTLVFVSLCFSICVFLHPLNGISFLLLCVPLFLGNGKRPYFGFWEVFIGLTCLSALVHFLFLKSKTLQLKKTGWWGFLVFLFLLSLCLSVPLNVRILTYYLRGTPLLESWKVLWSGHEGFDLYYLRTLFNGGSAVILFLIPLLFLKEEKYLTQMFVALAQVFCVVLFFSFLLRFDWIDHPHVSLNPRTVFKTNFLSLQLYGMQLVGLGRIGMTGFSYNMGYFAQYLIVSFPFLFYFIYRSRKKALFLFFATMPLLPTLSGMFSTYQRAPLMVLFTQTLFFFALFFLKGTSQKREGIEHQNKKSLGMAVFKIFMLGLVLLSLLLAGDFLLTKGAFLERLRNTFENSGPRLKIWKTAWTMFIHHPLMGVGVGKYHHFFPQYCTLAGIPWRTLGTVRTTAHNFYLHLLAEQGLVGFSCFMVMGLTFFLSGVRSLKKMSQEQQALMITVLISLLGWLVYGLTQHMFYLRSMQLLFWILLGFVAVLARPHLECAGIPKKVLMFLGGGFILLLTYRAFIVFTFPV